MNTLTKALILLLATSAGFLYVVVDRGHAERRRTRRVVSAGPDASHAAGVRRRIQDEDAGTAKNPKNAKSAKSEPSAKSAKSEGKSRGKSAETAEPTVPAPAPPTRAQCMAVNRQYDNPGKVTCGCVPSDDPCLTDAGENGPQCILDVWGCFDMWCIDIDVLERSMTPICKERVEDFATE